MASNVGFSGGFNNLTTFEIASAGAFTGAFSRLIGQPLDVLKIRFQLQVEPTRNSKGGGHYHGILQSFRLIVKEEGVKALWRGHISAQCLTILYSSSKFCSYHSLTWAFTNHYHELNSTGRTSNIKSDETSSSKIKLSAATLSLCASLSAVCGTAFSMPFDVSRTRIVAQSTNQYTGWPDVWRQMFKQDGIRSLWRGFLPTLGSSVPFAAIQFPVYSKLMELSNWGDTGLLYRSTVSGVIAGLLAKSIIYPLDVLKKRSQMRGAEDLRKNFGKQLSGRIIH